VLPQFFCSIKMVIAAEFGLEEWDEVVALAQCCA
jgi:hypothetical protein